MSKYSEKKLLKRHLENIEEIFKKSDSENSALLESNLYYILSEGEIDQPDVEKLRAQTNELEAAIKKLVSIPEISKLPSAQKWFQQQLNNIAVVKKFIFKLDLNQPPSGLSGFLKKTFGKQVTPKKALAAVALIDAISTGAVSGIKKTFSVLSRNIENMSNLKTDLQGKPLRDISPDSGVTIGDIEAGIEKAFTAAKSDSIAAKSNKVAKNLSSMAAVMPGTSLSDFPQEAVKNEILALNLPDFENLTKGFESAQNPDLPQATLQDIVSAEEKMQAGASIPKDKIGKAAEAWLKKLKDDGGDEALMKLGKVWITAVSNDSDFKKLIGLEESVYLNSFNLILEQVKWPDLISVFKKNAPGPFKTLSDKDIEPLISPFGAALADQGVEVHDASGKPIQIKDTSSEELIDDVESKVEEDSEESSDPEKGSNKKAQDLLDSLKSFLEKPEEAINKILSAFDIELKESKLFSLRYLLNEKSIKYSEIEEILQGHLPENPKEKFKAIQSIKDAIQQNLGSDHDITEFPKEEDLDLNQELDIEDPEQLTDKEETEQDQVANRLSGALGKTPIDKNSLANILKSYPDITGTGSKATKARRNLRKAINTAAGMEVFAEKMDYSQNQNKYLIQESKKYNPIERWKKLAGIKDD